MKAKQKSENSWLTSFREMIFTLAVSILVAATILYTITFLLLN